MTTIASRFPALPGPRPRERPLGTLGFLLALRSNPLSAWTERHFEEPILAGRGLLGDAATVSDPVAIRHILLDNAGNYRKDKLQRRLLAPGLGDGLLTVEGDAWRAQRRALAPLFNPRRVADFFPAMVASADWLIGRWERLREGRRIDAASEMSRATLDVLERTIFPNGLGRDAADIAGAATRYFDTIGRISPLDILDLPPWVPRLGQLRAAPALAVFADAVDRLIAARRQTLDSDPGGSDLLTLLLRAADPETGQGLSEEDVRSNIVTFIAAGHETTANTLTWTLFLLARHPEWRDRVEAEIAAAVPGGALPPDVASRLPLTRAVIDEALRLYPPAASLTREAIAPDLAGPLRVRPGMTIIISPWVLHRHRRLWDEPLRFDPDRFSPARRESIDRFAYLPFGAGPRVCIGASFALQEALILLVSLMRRFRLDSAPGHEPVPVQRITLRSGNGMPMILRRR